MQSKAALKASKDLTPEGYRNVLTEQIRMLKKFEEQNYFLEVVRLTSGKSFGELALIKNKPRAATIKCI